MMPVVVECDNLSGVQLDMFGQEYKVAYDRDGFVVVREFLTGDDFQQLTANVDRYIRDVVPTSPDADAFFQDRTRPETLKQIQRMEQDGFFNQYRQHPRWNALAELLVGEPVKARGPAWFNKPPATDHPTPPHQDNYYFCLKPPSVATLWVALDAADKDNGCLRYVRESYRHGIRPHNTSKVLGFSQGITDYGATDAEREEAMCLQPGDLIAHHGQTIHRADPNHSKRHRRAFAMVFNGASARRDEEAYTRYRSNMKQQHSGMGLEAK